MVSWMLWESSVITFVKDLGHKWCSRNVVPYFVNPPFEEERDGFCFNSFLPLFPFPALVLRTLASFHLHACFLSQGQPVTSGGTQASHCKPDVFSPAVKQEAAQDSRLCLAGSDVLLWSSRTPHLEDDTTSHLHLWGSFTDWILCRPEGACYLAVPERCLLFLFTQCYYFSLWCLIYQHLSDRLLLIWKGRRKYALFKMFSKSLLNFSLNR